MKKVNGLSIYSIVFTLLTNAAQAMYPSDETYDDQPPKKLLVRADAKEHQLKLTALKIDGTLWLKNGDTFSQDGTNVIVTKLSADWTDNPIKVNVRFQLENNVVYDLVSVLEDSTSPIINNLPKYDPQQKISNYIIDINKKFSKIPQTYQWKSVDNDLGGLGCPIIEFIDPQAMRGIIFSDKCIHDNSEDRHETTLKVKCCLDNDQNNSHDHIIYTIKHSSEPADLPKIKYIDDQRCLKNVKSITWTTVPKRSQEWGIEVGLLVKKYHRLEESDPTPDAAVLIIAPNDIVENKYYKLGKESHKDSKYIWTDSNNFFRTRIMESSYVPVENPRQPNDEFLEEKEDNKSKITTLEKTLTPFNFPNNLEFIVQGNFLPGYYRLEDTTKIKNGILQSWIPYPPTGRGVKISINGVDTNIESPRLPNFLEITSEERDGRTIFNVSNLLHKMDDTQYGNLKNLYLTYWLDLKEPIFKYHSKGKKEIEVDSAYLWLNVLINDIKAINFDIEEARFIEFGGRNQCTLRSYGEFSRRDFTKDSIWWIYGTGSYCKKLISFEKSIDSFNFGTCELSTCLPTLLAIHECEQIKTIDLSEFRSQDVMRSNTESQQIASLLPKLTGLQRLELSELSLDGKYWYPSVFQCLECNAATLQHLDCVAINKLDYYGDLFVEAVKKMRNLRSINLSETDLSNSQTVALAKALVDKKKLVEVGLGMPYWRDSGVKTAIRYTQEKLLEYTTLPVFSFTCFLSCVLTFINTNKFYQEISSRTCIPTFVLLHIISKVQKFFLVDKAIINSPKLNYGIDFDSVFESLAEIEKLKNLNLQTRGKIDENFLQSTFNELREKRKFEPTTIQFNKPTFCSGGL